MRIVEANPHFTSVSVRSANGVFTHNGQGFPADLVVGQQTLLSGKLAFRRVRPVLLSGSTNTIIGWIHKSKRTSIGCHTQGNLVRRKALVDPVLSSESDCQVIPWASHKGSMVSGYLVPAAVEVIAHQVQDIQGFAKFAHLVGLLNGDLSCRHGSSYQKPWSATLGGLSFECV